MNIILYGNISADMIKVKNFEMRKLSWIIQVSPKCHHSVFIKRKAEGDETYRHTSRNFYGFSFGQSSNKTTMKFAILTDSSFHN